MCLRQSHKEAPDLLNCSTKPPGKRVGLPASRVPEAQQGESESCRAKTETCEEETTLSVRRKALSRKRHDLLAQGFSAGSGQVLISQSA